VVIRYSESTKEMDDLDEMLRKPEIQNLVEETRRSFQFILAGNSQRDVEYQEKALDEILAETGGRKIGSFPESAQRWMLSGLISQGYLNSFGILAGGWKGSFAQIGPPDFQIKIYKASVELKRKHIEEGTIVNDGGDAMFGPLSLCGGGGECGDEQFMHYDPRDPASVEGGGQYLVDAGRVAARLGWGGGTDALVTEPSKEEAKGRLLRSPQPIAYLWQWKIKQALDPNDTGDVGYPYLTDEESGATT
jgi:hypothetical protein